MVSTIHVYYLITVLLCAETCCTALMNMAKEARKSRLGPLHPAYNLLQNVQDSLLGNLPEDAHVRVSGKLCVSLTRVSDGRNVLVSEFDSREELIQVCCTVWELSRAICPVIILLLQKR